MWQEIRILAKKKGKILDIKDVFCLKKAWSIDAIDNRQSV